MGNMSESDPDSPLRPPPPRRLGQPASPAALDVSEEDVENDEYIASVTNTPDYHTPQSHDACIQASPNSKYYNLIVYLTKYNKRQKRKEKLKTNIYLKKQY